MTKSSEEIVLQYSNFDTTIPAISVANINVSVSGKVLQFLCGVLLVHE